MVLTVGMGTDLLSRLHFYLRNMIVQLLLFRQDAMSIKFLEMWQTRADRANAELAGKFLAVLPDGNGAQASADFFRRTVRRQSANAVAQQAFRPGSR